MNKERKLFRDTILYAIANFGSSALTFLMLPLYTRYFSPEQYGTWDLFVTTITLLVPFITFELTSATYRWLLDQTDDLKSTIISTGFFQLIRHAIVFNIITIAIFLLIDFSYQWEALLLININMINSFLLQCARGLKRNKLFAGLGILQTAIIVGFNLLFLLVFRLGIEALFYANILAGLIALLFAWKKLHFNQYLSLKNRSKELLRDYISYAVPIIPAAASWWVMTMADRWIIAAFLGITANGIYAVAIKIPAVLLMVNTVFSLAWKDSAIISYHTKEKNTFYTKTYQTYFRFMATTVICLTLLAKPVIAIFLGDAYIEAWKYSGILLTATLFHALALFWSAGFHGAKQTTSILSTSIIGAIINVILNILLIKFIGLYAVAISTLVAFLVTWIMRVRAAKKYFSISFNYRDMVGLFLLIILAGIIPFWVGTKGLVASLLINIIIFFTYNRNVLAYVWNELVVRLKNVYLLSVNKSNNR